MSTIQAAQQAVQNVVTKLNVQFSIGTSKDSHGEFIVVSFAHLPANVGSLPTSVGGFRVQYKTIA